MGAPLFLPFYDSFQPHDNDLTQYPLFVATTSFKSQQKCCKSPKVALPLHRRKETDDKVNNKNKRKFWHKHINVFKKHLSAVESVKKAEGTIDKVEFRIKRSDTFSKKNKYEGLFILGVLESAAKEKKRRRTLHIKKVINNNNNDQKVKDEDKKWKINSKVNLFLYMSFYTY